MEAEQDVRPALVRAALDAGAEIRPGPDSGRYSARNDQLGSVRMRILELLVLVAAIGAVYVASQTIRATLALVLVALWLVTTGFGIVVLGVPPGSDEVGRGLLFLLVTLFYAGVWLSLALLFSLLFRQPSASAMVSLGVWIFFAMLWPVFAQSLAPEGTVGLCRHGSERPRAGCQPTRASPPD
ncbi:MAG: ABC transporter permease [Burkholderiales bacterium]|nr:ABC transporter permease [Burkholderiales bacterium]